MQLTGYQNKTIQELISNYERGIQRNLAVLATGLGKTFIATEFHRRFKPKKKTLFLVDRKELAYQAKESFLETDPTLNVGIEMNTHHASKKDDVVIASVHTIGRKGSYRIGKFEPDDFGKIIVDEAHMSVSDIFIRCLNYLGVGPDNLEEGRILVGLTATPNRTDGVPLSRVYDTIAVEFDLAYGIRNGWLTDMDVLQVESEVDISHVKTTKSDFDLEELTKAINIERRNQIIVKSYLDTSYGKSAIVYCSSVDHAYKIAELFKKNGVSAECIESQTDTKERKEFIKQYKRGKIKVLCNYGTLTTGFNAPETSCIILGRPIKSDLLIRQIIGRGLRPSKFAFVYMAKTKEQRLDQIAKSVKPSCKIIDIHDIIDDDTVCSVASLFGFARNLEIPEEQEKFFQQIVEPVEAAVKDLQVDVKEITNIEDLHLLVKRKPVKVSSLKPTDEVAEHSDRPWLPTTDNQYEIVYAKEKHSLIVEKNQLDKYDLYVVNNKTSIGKRLQTFNDLSGAINLGDQYADEHFDTTFERNRAEWESNGVSKAQADFLIKLYKGGVRVDRYKRYEDTGVPVMYFRKTGERIDAGLCSDLIKQRIGK